MTAHAVTAGRHNGDLELVCSCGDRCRVPRDLHVGQDAMNLFLARHRAHAGGSA